MQRAIERARAKGLRTAPPSSHKPFGFSPTGQATGVLGTARYLQHLALVVSTRRRWWRGKRASPTIESRKPDFSSSRSVRALMQWARLIGVRRCSEVGGCHAEKSDANQVCSLVIDYAHMSLLRSGPETSCWDRALVLFSYGHHVCLLVQPTKTCGYRTCCRPRLAELWESLVRLAQISPSTRVPCMHRSVG